MTNKAFRWYIRLPDEPDYICTTKILALTASAVYEMSPTPTLVDRALHASYVDDHWKKLIESIRRGEVHPVDADGAALRISAQYLSKDALASSKIRYGEFRWFAESLHICIERLREFKFPARPTSIASTLMEIDSGETITVLSPNGEFWRRQSAGKLISDIEAVMERQAQSYFTVWEAVQILVDENPGLEQANLIAQLQSGYDKRELLLRHPMHYAAQDVGRDIRQKLGVWVVKVDELNAWFKRIGFRYRLPLRLKMSKAPMRFCNALKRLLIEVQKRADAQAQPFDPMAMPGRKVDFQALADKFDPALEYTQRTFDDYLAGLCTFKRGARVTDFYTKLFPEFFSNRR